MPRVFNQKIKILYLMRVFLERTDEEHPMSVKELIHLSEQPGNQRRAQNRIR